MEKAFLNGSRSLAAYPTARTDLWEPRSGNALGPPGPSAVSASKISPETEVKSMTPRGLRVALGSTTFRSEPQRCLSCRDTAALSQNFFVTEVDAPDALKRTAKLAEV